jgi:3-oxoacyl-[acyl-carrier-protein] synthase-3
MGAYITQTGVCLPNQPIENDQIESVLGMIAGRPSRSKNIVLRSNGIRQRYYVIDASTGEPVFNNAQLTAQAIRNLLNSGNLVEIDCLVCGTSIPDQIAPGHAVMVHGELKTNPCEVITTAGICLSGMNALKYAWLAVKSGEHKTVVASGSEVTSTMLHARHFAAECTHKVDILEKNPEISFEKDFLRWMLSDGAGAFLVEDKPVQRSVQPVLKIEWIKMLSWANELETCMYSGAEKEADGNLKGWKLFNTHELLNHSIFSIKQDVRLLNENIVPYAITKTLRRVIKETALTSGEVDYFLPHISSMYFYDKVKDALIDMDFEIPQEKWFTNLQEKGNTGAASIFIMLDELVNSGKLESGNKLLCFVPESGRFSSAYMLLTVT